MKSLTRILVLTLGLLFFQIAMSQVRGVFPTEEDFAGVRSICGSGSSNGYRVKGEIDAALKNWMKADGGVEASAAKEQLAAYLTRLKKDEKLEGPMKIYVDCVDRQIQRFLDRERNMSSSNAQPAQPVRSSNGRQQNRMILRRNETYSNGEITATLLDINSQGAILVVNGHKVPHLHLGRRLVVTSPSRSNESCYVEIIKMSSPEESPAQMTLDHVCDPKRR